VQSALKAKDKMRRKAVKELSICDMEQKFQTMGMVGDDGGKGTATSNRTVAHC